MTKNNLKFKSTSLKYPIHSWQKNNEKSRPDSENNISNVTIENKGFTISYEKNKILH